MHPKGKRTAGHPCAVDRPPFSPSRGRQGWREPGFPAEQGSRKQREAGADWQEERAARLGGSRIESPSLGVACPPSLGPQLPLVISLSCRPSLGSSSLARKHETERERGDLARSASTRDSDFTLRSLVVREIIFQVPLLSSLSCRYILLFQRLSVSAAAVLVVSRQTSRERERTWSDNNEERRDTGVMQAAR